MPQDDDASIDAEIITALRRGRPEAWAALWEAVDELDGETTFATWAGGEAVRTTMVDGEEQPVYQMPYPLYSEPVQRVLACLGGVGLIVPFDWMGWKDLPRYRDHPSDLATAPVTDAVRILIAIQRSERFVDGSIEGALESKLMQTAFARIRRWCEENPPDPAQLN